ncbi:MAG: histidinol dehydrogenase [Actinomycetes bacterium]|jgi:histidinol dehydrogenase|nr:histidinol dehydrogenase [Actinomycetes bacterium]
MALMRRIELAAGERLTEQILDRSGGIDDAIDATARAIVADVAARGDAAIKEYTARFDAVNLTDLRVPATDIAAAYDAVSPELVAALRKAADRIRAFHERQVQQSWFTTEETGTLLGQKITPIARVGIYAPGGRADYPSSVLMNVIPAQVAGVPEIAVIGPPQPHGTIVASTLVAADICGVTEIYRVGGAQAIAALAYGTESIPAVDKITGPGNAYVAAAKRCVQGRVGIDMIAGPSEVLVLTDDTADASQVAIDLMAQAEHDPRAAVYLVTTDATLPDQVESELSTLLEMTTRADITRTAISDNGVALICPDLDTAVAAANVIAPEHLEVLTRRPMDLLGAITTAGAIFLGPWTPEPVGDYLAGPNHTLPTEGTARFSSPLTVDDFVKKTSVLRYTPAALAADADAITTLADTEGFWSHAQAVRMRMELLHKQADGGKDPR